MTRYHDRYERDQERRQYRRDYARYRQQQIVWSLYFLGAVLVIALVFTLLT